jgi:cobalt-zinc-cadmium efflux system outer membrane protein
MRRIPWIHFRLAALLSVLLLGHHAAAEPVPPDARSTVSLRELVELARRRAPEVMLARSELGVSRSSAAMARLAPVGNPYLEVKVDRGSRGVTRDVTVDGSLWLPVEVSGQRQGRGREARDYVRWHEALVAQARAVATGRTVRAFGALAVATTRLHVLGEILGVAQAEADYYAARLAAGDATEPDAALSALEAARHAVLLSEARVDVERSAGELKLLTGYRPSEGSVLDASPPAFAPVRAVSGPEVSTPTTAALAEQARYYGSAAVRLGREGWAPLNLGITGGRGDLGETRLGVGVGYAFPLFRANQSERARAEAERVRALEELSLRRGLIRDRVAFIERELAEIKRALDVLTTSALPAANRAVNAATETHRAGKGDWLSVLVSRRDLSTLALRRLDLLDRSWSLWGDLTEITGELP